MKYTEIHEILGLLVGLLVDFEKAFESLSWTFIDKAVNIFTFKNLDLQKFNL